MYKVNIVQLPKKVLREKSHNIKLPLSKENIELAKTMIYHITNSSKEDSEFRSGVGIAAVQYGVLKNMFYVRVPNNNDEIILEDLLINPRIVAHSESKAALKEGEGCLSVSEEYPAQNGFVPRYYRIVVEGFSYLKNKKTKIDISGYPAIVLQHELDHLQGKLFLDRIDQKHPWTKDEQLIII